MPHDWSLLGIDIGSVSVSVVEVNRQGELIRGVYSFHRGQARRCLERILEDFDLSSAGGVAATASTPELLVADQRYDSCVSVITAIQRVHGQIGSILIVGGENFGLIRFDAEGNYRSYKGNTSCASGTGSFLDQQARRLKLNGAEELSALACRNHGTRPKIATRCAVFAKTDLVHAQQEGHSLVEICDGLCYGLARNIVDTVFRGTEFLSPVVFAGGVSLNRAVVQHLENLLGHKLIIDDSPLHGALGAALLLLEEPASGSRGARDSKTVLFKEGENREEYLQPPLELKSSGFPNFTQSKTDLFTAGGNRDNPVEIDCYEILPRGGELEAYLGIDIGSTSTKAVLMGIRRRVISGFYTRTSGRPLEALQKIFAAIDQQLSRRATKLKVLAAGTTGAGRKFAGKVIGADLVLNEISAHARAAVELNPAVDTILEIGGQDSKFTIIRDGVVTFSVMNTVCAAGTGSFIEEQAEKLGCPLEDIAVRTEKKCAPISSDRCTVFMERDINHFLNNGYTVDQVLASVLHSIVENYLTKVAVEGRIGQTILFQGATAKNRSLVAAFEQRLGRRIQVSKYCHLTGALGVALRLADAGVRATSFRGIQLHKRHIPVESEVCSLCTNHCKITLAHVEDSKIAYGFLCGRDYDTRRYVDSNSSGFDLLKARKRATSFRQKPIREHRSTVAIPAALHLQEDLPLWKYFFNQLGIPVRTSEHHCDALKTGKNLSGAEFCAPIAALHGHIRYLLDRGDYVFVPFYLERKPKADGNRRQYCYYTQFAPALVSGLLEDSAISPDRLLTPLVHYLYHSFHTKAQLYRMLTRITERRIGFFEVSAAFDEALAFRSACEGRFREIYSREAKDDELHVVLLGRPYSVLSRAMNKEIPQILARHGIKVFFQDMLPLTGGEDRFPGSIPSGFQWYFAQEILQGAEKVTRSPSAYPVLVTSFKCSPDSFAVEYFRELMEAHGKPYLILQLDEHDSRVGYETRIEAALESFHNHFMSSATEAGAGRIQVPSVPGYDRDPDLKEKILLIPNWDDLTHPLVVANLQREGIDARLLRGSPKTIQKGLHNNNGQCTPLSIIAQEFIDYIQDNDLDPARALLWIPQSNISCNICMFPHYIRRILQSRGGRMAQARVHIGTLSFIDVSIRLPVNIYFAYMFGGFLRKVACHIRPYECDRGLTDQAVRMGLRIFQEAVLENRDREEAVKEVVSLFSAIRTESRPCAKVAIFGDLYVRDNDAINQGLIQCIENHGGEVVTTPYTAFIRMVSGPYLRKWVVEGDLLGAISSKALLAMVNRSERIYLRHFQEVLGDSEADFSDSAEEILSEYGVRLEHTGESMENLLKVHYIRKQYPDVALFVQTSPAFCCPSLVTEAMADRIERRTGVPVVSITYDGTGGDKNHAVIPYLKCPRAAGCNQVSGVSSL